jgi:hypothetical protein
MASITFNWRQLIIDDGASLLPYSQLCPPPSSLCTRPLPTYPTATPRHIIAPHTNINHHHHTFDNWGDDDGNNDGNNDYQGTGATHTAGAGMGRLSGRQCLPSPLYVFLLFFIVFLTNYNKPTGIRGAESHRRPSMPPEPLVCFFIVFHRFPY